MKIISVAAGGALALLFALSAAGDDAQNLVGQATIPLEKAIEHGLREASGGAVVKAELEKEDGRVVYSLDVAQGTRILELHIDPKDGSVVGRENENEDQSKLAAAKVTLGQAVAAALAAQPGQAVSDEYEDDKGKLVAEVKVVANGKVVEVTVDATTGQVTEVER
jgi:uncharacterized membrane protein YkoI